MSTKKSADNEKIFCLLDFLLTFCIVRGRFYNARNNAVPMINTYNETSLHKTLKTIYQLQNEGSMTEQRIEQKSARHAVQPAKGYIFDIVTSSGDVIEIQTGSLGHLLPKVLYLIAEKRNVTIVFPLAATKYIQTQNTNDGSTRKRKSPAAAKIYSYKFFRELTALCPVLTNKYVTLEVLEVTMTEERTASDELVQSPNGRRRFRKNWNKTGKHLDSIDGKHVFHGKKSWLLLLPKTLRGAKKFTVNSLLEEFAKEGIKLRRNDVQLLVWVFSHAQLIECTGKIGKANEYQITANRKS
jgi:hypothetical protein